MSDDLKNTIKQLERKLKLSQQALTQKNSIIKNHNDAFNLLKQKEHLTSTVIESNINAVVAINEKHIVTIFNKSAEMMFGYSKQEMLNKDSLHNIIPKHFFNRHTEASTNFFKTKKSCGAIDKHLELEGKRKDGTIFPIRIGFGVTIEKDTIVVVANVEDITFEKQIQDDLKKTNFLLEQKSKAKSEFLANMSHEIRTPLNAILGFVEILKDENIGRKTLEHVNIIHGSSKNLLQIIKDILDFSKIESGKLDIYKTDFNTKEEFEIITHLFSAKCSQKNLSLTLNLDKSLPSMINTDPLRVKQVISNLLSNAIKFTDNGKRIEVKIDYKDNYLNVSVYDEGKGIAKDKLNHIFESFTQEDSSTTREYGGTGLGLSISSELVKLLGGELKVKSEVIIGSEFYFSIPVEIGKDIEETQELQEDITFDDKKILLVEDNEFNQILIEEMLKKLNIKYDIANDGLEAVDRFKQSITSLKNRYDLILMDENMPNLNGIEATKRILEIKIQKKLSHTPIIALTANALKGDREKFLAAGMDEYLTKPIGMKKFAKILASFLS